MKWKLYTSAISLFVLSSCGTNGPDKDASLPMPASTTQQSGQIGSDTSLQSTSAGVPGAIPSNVPGGVISPTGTNTITAVPPTNAGPLNPAHGQPGHRCDIPVGAPLSSPKQAPTTTQSSTPVPSASNQGAFTVQPAPAPAVAATAPGMNPPHGQPGHRCDIAVGVPLNSPQGTTLESKGNPSIPANVSTPSIPPSVQQAAGRKDSL